MSRLALALSLGAVVLACMPSPLLFIGLGIGILALTLGAREYRDKKQAGGSRLVGAGAMCLSGFAMVVSLARFAITLIALESFL
jgi:hypothetical protein